MPAPSKTSPPCCSTNLKHLTRPLHPYHRHGHRQPQLQTPTAPHFHYNLYPTQMQRFESTLATRSLPSPPPPPPPPGQTLPKPCPAARTMLPCQAQPCFPWQPGGLKIARERCPRHPGGGRRCRSYQFRGRFNVVQWLVEHGLVHYFVAASGWCFAQSCLLKWPLMQVGLWWCLAWPAN